MQVKHQALRVWDTVSSKAAAYSYTGCSLYVCIQPGSGQKPSLHPTKLRGLAQAVTSWEEGKSFSNPHKGASPSSTCIHPEGTPVLIHTKHPHG